MSDEIKVMVKFTIKEDGLSFTDALYYDLAGYSSIPKATIDNAKVARFNGFKQAILDAKNAPKPTKQEQLLRVTLELTELTKRVDELTTQKLVLQADIGASK